MNTLSFLFLFFGTVFGLTFLVIVILGIANNLRDSQEDKKLFVNRDPWTGEPRFDIAGEMSPQEREQRDKAFREFYGLLDEEGEEGED